MTKITRVGVTFPPDLLKDFDEITSKMGYESRSKAIQDAVRLYVSERKWLKGTQHEQTGMILMVYDHDVEDLESGLTEVQHEHSRIARTTRCTCTSANETVLKPSLSKARLQTSDT